MLIDLEITTGRLVGATAQLQMEDARLLLRGTAVAELVNMFKQEVLRAVCDQFP